MSDEIKVGDVVMLISGSLPMTVSKIEDELASCVWFERGHVDWSGPFYGKFAVDTLEKVSK